MLDLYHKLLQFSPKGLTTRSSADKVPEIPVESQTSQGEAQTPVMFTAAEIVDWMLTQNMAESRDEALELARTLSTHNIITTANTVAAKRTFFSIW